MKKKNLEKAVILGLLLSTSIYGTAFATVSGVLKDGTVVDDVYEHFGLNRDANGGIYINNDGYSVDTDKDGVGDIYYPENEVLGGEALNKFKEITVDINKPVNSAQNGIYLEDFDLVAPETNFTVNIGTKDEPLNKEAHGILLNTDDGERTTYLAIGNYTANIYALNSNAFTVDNGLVKDVNAKINGDFTATVSNGSGINASASYSRNVMSQVSVKGDTQIIINADKITVSTEEEVHTNADRTGISSSSKSEITYNPAAVYAGNTACNFYFAGTPVESGNGTQYFGKGYYGYETVGQANINLEGNIVITTNGDNNYGIYSGKNGEINLNTKKSDLTITANGKNSIGIAAINNNLIYNEDTNFTNDYTHLGFGDIKGVVDVILDQSENTYGSTVVLNGTNNTITMAEGGKALYADAKNSTDNDKEVIIKSSVNGIGNLDVKGYIVATNSGIIDLTVNKAADITGDIEATNSGVINFTLGDNADMIVSEKDNTLINAGGASTLSLAKNGSESKIGNVQAANGGTINLTLGEGAYFAGRVDDYKDADGANGNWNNEEHQTLFDSEFAAGVTKSGTVNMTLNGGVWDLTQQSWVTNLNGNDGVVYLNGNGTGGYAVHIGKLEGDHTFVLNLNPKEHEFSDMLYIYDGSTAGVQNLRINNEAEVLNALKDDGDRIRFATVGKTAGAGAGFGDDYVVRGRGVINSGFSIDYVDYEEDKQNADYTTDYNGDDFDSDKPGNSYVENVYGEANGADDIDSQNLYLVRDSSKDAGKSDSGATIINMSRANYKNAIYMDRINKRMG